MSKNKERNISVTGPTTLGKIKLKEPSTYAAGFAGIKVALSHTFKEMGVVKSLKTLSHMNQKDGFDCPGCAWPDPDKRSKLGEYCENGAKALAEEATSLQTDNNFFAKYSIEELSNWSDYAIGKSGRLVSPMILEAGSVHYKPISWEKSYQLIVKHLRKLDNPNEAIFYTSGRSSNEAAFLYGLFVRAFGTNNMPDCSNMCHESSGVALNETLGIGKGSVTLDDFEHAEVVIVMGQNPGTNHPRMLSALEKCKKNGGKVVSINPLKEAGLLKFNNPQEVNGLAGNGTNLTDIYLQVRINEDVSLLKLILKKLIKLNEKDSSVFDHQFIKEKTEGYQALIEDLSKYNESDLIKRCGIEITEVERLVNLLAKKKKIIVCWAMGLTQHKNAVDNIKEIVNLLLLKGSIGKKGAGTCPVRGHSNVQGDRTVGIMHHVSTSLNQSIEKVFGFSPPQHEGLDTVHSIKAMYERKAKVFIALGGNFLSAASDTNYTAQALQNCELTVSISTKLNRTHLVTGKTALILPTLGRSEMDVKNGKKRYVTVENSMGKVHKSSGILPPASIDLMSEPEIIARIADCYFGSEKINWKELGSDYQLIREKISEVITGFDDYSKKTANNGFYLPNNARQGNFDHLSNSRAKFSLCQISQIELKKDEFVMMTIRSHDQFNTTIYDLNDRYRGIFNERRIVLINKNDLLSRGLNHLDCVNITSHYDGKLRVAENFVLIAYDIPEGNLASYFPETNVLVPINHFASKSNTPISKSIIVKLHKR